MLTNAAPRPSPLALTVLFMLIGEPLHPYEMQRRMKHWCKDRVVNLGQRASLYKTIDRLTQAGLIAIRQTVRDGRFPERTVYELTDEGLRVGRQWLVEMLATPQNEFPPFPAALSFVFGLYPKEALTALEQRRTQLGDSLAELDRELSFETGQSPPRVTLLDSQYLRALTAAELKWLEGVIEELHSGALTWSGEELREAAKAFVP